MATRLPRLFLASHLNSSYVKHLSHFRVAVRWPAMSGWGYDESNCRQIHSSVSGLHLSKSDARIKESTKALSEHEVSKANDIKGKMEAACDSNLALFGESDKLRKFAHKLYEIDSEHQLVNLVESEEQEKSLSLTQAMLILRHLASVRCSHTSDLGPGQAVNAPFGELVERLNAEIGNEAGNMDIALSALGALLQLRMEPSKINRIVEFIRNSMMTRMSMGQLVRFLGNVLPWTSTKPPADPTSPDNIQNDNLAAVIESLRREAFSAVEHRWVEISSPKDIVTLMHLLPSESDRLMSRLSERALEQMDKMSMKQLHRMLYCLTRRQMRNTPMIRSVTYHINKMAACEMEHGELKVDSFSNSTTDDEGGMAEDADFKSKNIKTGKELSSNVDGVVETDLKNKDLRIDSESSNTKKVYSLQPLTLRQISNLAFACATLNVYNTQLLRNIGQSAIIVSSQMNPSASISLLASIVHSFAELRWYDKEVLDSIFRKYLKVSVNENSTGHTNGSTISHQSHNAANISDAVRGMVKNLWLRSEDLTSLVISLACLNYLAPKDSLRIINARLLKEFLALANKSVSADALKSSAVNERAWLDFVWSSAVLGVMTHDLAATVLNRAFANEIKNSANSAPSLIKLVNIHAYVRSFLPQYSGELLESQLINQAVSSISARKPGSLKKSLLESLAAVLTVEKYVRLDVTSPCGYIIDAEVLTNDLGQPQPITEQTESVEGQGPAEYHRVAIKLLDFSDMTFGPVVRPTGYHALGMELLQSAGYVVVPIYHSEFQKEATIAKRAQIVQTKIRQALNDKQASSTSAKNWIRTSSTPDQTTAAIGLDGDSESAEFLSAGRKNERLIIGRLEATPDRQKGISVEEIYSAKTV